MTENLNTRFVKLEVDQRVALITMDNAPVNALSPEVIRELDLIIQAVKDNSKIDVVVLTGNGDKAFVAGADIKAMKDFTPQEAEEMAKHGQMVFQHIQDMYKVVICAINGLALGGGLELAMACDIRICSSTAKLGQPEINLGIIPGFGGTQRLPRLIGVAQAKELLLTGDMIDAERAYDLGLVNHITAPQDVLKVAKEMANKIASKGSESLHYIQKCVDKGVDMPLEEGLALEATSFGVIFGTPDKTEGINAFLEKRAPQFNK